VTFEDKRSQSAIQSDRQRDLFLFCTPRLRHKSRNPIRAGCATEQCKDRLSRRKAAAPDIEEAHLAVLRPQLLPKSRRN